MGKRTQPPARQKRLSHAIVGGDPWELNEQDAPQRFADRSQAADREPNDGAAR